jgi:nitrate reductase molybdenum cofactor assembly chaperone NarJ/NarW
MNASLKVISLLLSYPTKLLQGAGPEIEQVLAVDRLIDERQRAALQGLASDIAGRDIYDAQEQYVLLFDRTRALSLHLFEHVHGESRDRGQAMVDLMAMYDDHGFEVDARELPDYLPMFLEFLSIVPEAEARELLRQTLHIVVALKERLTKRDSIYANAFGVLEEIAQGQADEVLVNQLAGQPEDDPNDLEALDRIWEEEVVTFGGNAGENSCGADRLRTQLRAAHRRPADSAQPIDA